jgi:LmbE family N-acetylglucosaminyl deacetylase
MTKREAACAVLSRLRGLPDRAANRRFRSAIAHDPDGPILLLSPHLDDAVLNCWSVVTRPVEVVVVNVFAAVPARGTLTAWDRVCGADDSARLMTERVAEDREALARAGRDPVNLPFLDTQYRGCRPPPSFAALDAAVSATLSAASLVYAPLCARHADHRFARQYAMALGIPVRIYADIPYASELGWPHWVTGAPRHPRLDADAHLAQLVAAVPEIGDPRAAEVARLGDEGAAAKLAALRTYRSQFTALDAGPLQVLSNPAVHGFELFWTPHDGVAGL